MNRTVLRGLGLGLGILALAMVFPRDGGSVRIYFPGDPWDPMPAGLQSPADLLLSRAVFGTLVEAGPEGSLRPGLARSWERLEPEEDGSDRWVFGIDPLARFPEGRPLRPADVIASWEELLRSDGSRYRFLLQPVVGFASFVAGDAERLEGISEDGERLEVRCSRPTPDLLERLTHPALAVGGADRFGAPEGPGPFLPERRGDGLAANPFFRAGPPFLERFALRNDPGIDPALLVEAGEVEAALLLGRPAGELLERTPTGVRLDRAPAWDRVYALVIHPGRIPDVGVRAALSRSVDREGMVRVLFDRQGEAVASLLRGAGGAAPGSSPGDRGHGARLVLTFDRTDPVAESIAARVKASWEQIRFSVTLEGRDPPELLESLHRGEHVITLILHQPSVRDPVLSLQGTLDGIGAGLEPEQESLRLAASLADEQDRLAAALMAESAAIADQRLVPLVRLHAWLARDPRLVGVGMEAPGSLRLDEAFFLP